jgi:hypothetical protein
MNLTDFYVLVDNHQKIIIDKVQKLPQNWKNIAGLPGLSDKELSNLDWAGLTNFGWISISSNKIKEYYSPPENLELNKNTLKQLISEIRIEKQETEIKYKNIQLKLDQKSINWFFYKKIQKSSRVNFKIHNKFYTFTSYEISEICDIIERHIQNCFDWEMRIYNQIDACNKISDFLNIIL